MLTIIKLGLVQLVGCNGVLLDLLFWQTFYSALIPSFSDKIPVYALCTEHYSCHETIECVAHNKK